MKKKYIILIVFVILFAIVASGLLPLHELNPLICIVSNLPELQNPEFDEKTFYGYCDFNEDDETPILEDKQLKSIFANCECQESGDVCITPLYHWNNDTHYIDNNFCKFVQQPDVCTQSMMSFINQHSNMFEDEEPLVWTFRGSDSIVESDQFEECRDELLKINKKRN